MKRRDVLRAAAAAVPVLAARQVRAQEQLPRSKFPAEEKLTQGKRDVAEAMSRVRLENADAPDLLPRPRRRK